LLTEEGIVVAFRKDMLLLLDDCLHALQPTMPHLTRSSLHAACSATGQDCPDRNYRAPLQSRDHPESIVPTRLGSRGRQATRRIDFSNSDDRGGLGRTYPYFDA
jgi:hypothetical protein